MVIAALILYALGSLCFLAGTGLMLWVELK